MSTNGTLERAEEETQSAPREGWAGLILSAVLILVLGVVTGLLGLGVLPALQRAAERIESVNNRRAEEIGRLRQLDEATRLATRNMAELLLLQRQMEERLRRAE